MLKTPHTDEVFNLRNIYIYFSHFDFFITEVTVGLAKYESFLHKQASRY